MRVVVGVALVATTLVGCGTSGSGNTAHLQGKITIGGQPLPDDAEGYIQFMTTAAGQAPPSSADINGSSYNAEGVPLGAVNVIFNITRLTGRMVREDNAPGATPYPEREDLVPRKHRSGLQVEITGDDDAFDFEL